MRDKDRERYIIVLTALAAAYSCAVDSALIQAYWLGLGDLTIEQVEQAAREALRVCVYMPKPAEIRELAGVISPQHRAVLAWGEVLQAISEVGAYESVDFGDPATHASVRSVGGWICLCAMSDKELRFAQRDFERHYVASCKVAVSESRGKYLPGVSERCNAANGLAVKPPVIRALGFGLGQKLIESVPKQQDRARDLIASTAQRTAINEKK